MELEGLGVCLILDYLIELLHQVFCLLIGHYSDNEVNRYPGNGNLYEDGPWAVAGRGAS